MFWSVAAPKRPPNVIIDERQAKYMYKIEDKHCKLKPSTKSVKYQGALRLTSSIRPPKNLKFIQNSLLFNLT